MADKTPDQIRRETVPVTHNGLIYGFLYGLLGTACWFGGWAWTHQEQVRRYPEYCVYATKASMGDISLFGAPHKQEPGMSAEELRYVLLRYGNEDHRYDAEIIRHGWYPRDASPAAWVRDRGAVSAVYSESPALVFKWPLTLTLLTFVIALIWGLVADFRYQNAVVTGVQMDGSIVASVDQYNKELKGDGMKYRVARWEDR